MPKTKVCTNPACRKRKLVHRFSRDCTKKDGRRSHCKTCVAEADRARLAANPEKNRVRVSRQRAMTLRAIPAWVTEPMAAVIAQGLPAAQQDAYLAQVHALVAKYHADMADLEVDRALLARTWKVKMSDLHADHIVPLRGRTPEGHKVCGLHVPGNLMIRPAAENWTKNNLADPTLDALCGVDREQLPSWADLIRVL